MPRVTTDQLEKIQGRESAQNRPSSNDLEGIILDLCYFLQQSGALKVIRVKKTGELHRLIEVRCNVVSKSTSISDVAAEVERLWTEDIAYRNFEAHALKYSNYELVFDFITGTQYPDQYIYITGSIIVTA